MIGAVGLGRSGLSADDLAEAESEVAIRVAHRELPSDAIVKLAPTPPVPAGVDSTIHAPTEPASLLLARALSTFGRSASVRPRQALAWLTRGLPPAHDRGLGDALARLLERQAVLVDGISAQRAALILG
jgi:hypothetical protein